MHADEARPLALLEHEHDEAVGGTDESRFMTAALIGTRIERNTIISNRNDRATTEPMNQRQAVGIRCQVDELRVLTADVHRRNRSPRRPGESHDRGGG